MSQSPASCRISSGFHAPMVTDVRAKPVNIYGERPWVESVLQWRWEEPVRTQLCSWSAGWSGKLFISVWASVSDSSVSQSRYPQAPYIKINAYAFLKCIFLGPFHSCWTGLSGCGNLELVVNETVVWNTLKSENLGALWSPLQNGIVSWLFMQVRIWFLWAQRIIAKNPWATPGRICSSKYLPRTRVYLAISLSDTIWKVC